MGCDNSKSAKKGQVILLHGYPCSGKTFCADYLATIGWINIDGDQFNLFTDPKQMEFAGLVFGAMTKLGQAKPLDAAETKVMKDYYKMLCNQAKESAKKGTDTAISFVCYTKVLRDYCKSLIPDIKIIKIDVEESKMLARNRVRMVKMAEGNGMSLNDFWTTQVEQKDRDEFGEVYSDEVFDKYMISQFYRGLEAYADGEKNCFTIDNNDYGKPGLDRLREIVGIQGDFTYDQAAIENVQQARYTQMMEIQAAMYGGEEEGAQAAAE